MWQVEFLEKLKTAETRERKELFAAYEKLSGYSVPHLYRIAKERGFETGRKRGDRGVLKSGLTGEQVELIAAIIYTTGRENKGPIMPVERALQIAVDNGIIEEGQVAPVTLNRILRERQLSRRHMKAATPHTEMRSLHPNHTHVFDVSVCIQYYLRNGKMGIMDERDFYKNKPHNFEKVKTRLLRYVVVDHFSGAFHFKYFDTTGETQENLFSFLKEAWAEKVDEKLPFRGVPFNLLMDNGAANSSKAIVALLERMDVKVPKGKPYNPQRQGAVETLHTVIEDWFESGLRIQPAYTVEQLNAWAFDWTVRFQAQKKHTRHGMPRTQCWLMIKREELRILPPEDILHDLFANPEEERTVDGTYAISYRGNEYNLKHIEGLFRGAKVKAVLKPFKWPVIDIAYQGRVYEANPLTSLPVAQGAFRADAAIIGETYRPQRETETQQAQKRFENIAYGEERTKESMPFEGIRAFGHHADKVENLSFMPRQGTPIEVDRKVAEKSISIIEFFKRLRNETGTISPELNRELRERYGESIDTKEAEEVIRRIAEGDTELKKVSV